MGATLETFAPLAAPQFLQYAAASTGVYLLGFAGSGGLSKGMEAKRKAWLLTLMCSLGMSLGSMPYVWRLATEHGFVTAPFVYSDDWLSLLVMAWFMAFLVLDLLMGVVQYPKEIGFLTGYFHHTLYMAMCVWAVVNRITISAVATMIMEIPTFVLALGRVDKRCRSDAAFGLTFLLTRILYLGFYIHRLMQDRERIVIWPVCVPAMVRAQPIPDPKSNVHPQHTHAPTTRPHSQTTLMYTHIQTGASFVVVQGLHRAAAPPQDAPLQRRGRHGGGWRIGGGNRDQDLGQEVGMRSWLCVI